MTTGEFITRYNRPEANPIGGLVINGKVSQRQMTKVKGENDRKKSLVKF